MKVFVVLAVLLFAFPPFWALAKTPYNAIIMDTHGRVLLRHGHRTKPAGLGDLLYPGDAVETAKGATITVNYIESGREEKWPEKRKFSIGKGSSKQTGAGVMVSDRKIVLPALDYDRAGTLRLRGAAEKADDGTAGGLAAGQYPALEVKGLSNTSTLKDRPIFRWERVNPAESYTITLSDEGAEGTVWQTSTTGTEAAYPATLPALKASRHYRWTLEARRNGDVIAGKTSCFYLPGEEQAARLSEKKRVFEDRLSRDPEDTATRLALIFFLEGNNLYDEALEQYAILVGVRPEAESVRARGEHLLRIRGSACE